MSKMLNAGRGPAVEIQYFIQQHPEPSLPAFEPVDFNKETLDYTHKQMYCVMDRIRKIVTADFMHESMCQLLKRRITAGNP